LRQLAYTDEIVGIERADAMDHLVAQLRPGQTHVVIADMVAHAHGARGEDGDVGAALALKLELRAFEALADLVVGDLQRRLGGLLRRLLDVLHLLLAPPQQVFRLGRVMAVAIDDHDTVAFRSVGGMPVNAGPKCRPATTECYEPAFIIVKPGLGSVRMRGENTGAGRKAWRTARV